MKTLNKLLSFELEFTETYKKYKHLPPPLREAKCLEKFFEFYFQPIREEDYLAGRVKYPLIGFGTELTTNGSLYYCHSKEILNILKNFDFSLEEKEKILEMVDFWRDEKFIDYDFGFGERKIEGKFVNNIPEDILKATTNSVADMFPRLAGACINFEKLIKLGIPGLENEIRRYLTINPINKDFYEGLLISLDIFKRILLKYSKDAKNKGKYELSEILEKLVYSKPESFKEGLQLVWLYSLAAQVVNYGRMDLYLGDLYIKDLESRKIIEEDALKYILEFFKLITERRKEKGENFQFNARIIIGGRGRRNEENADKLALLLIKATEIYNEPEPQLSLRIYKKMNRTLYEKALDSIGKGKTFPILYNDDINIPAIAEAFEIPEEEAIDYIPYGCGEYAIDHKSINSPNSSLNLLKILEITLNNGLDPITGRKIGIETGTLDKFDTFEKLFRAYKKQAEYFIENLAKRHSIELELEKETASFLYISLLYDFCIERGKSILEGGAKYIGGLIESFGLTDTADSLYAIKKKIYDEKKYSLKELVDILKKNFEGYENIRQDLLNLPKYGNDIDEVDCFVVKLSNHICNYTKKLAKPLNMEIFLIVNINNYYNVEFGKITGASTNGRKKGEPLANGNNPTAGMDKNGITAFLNSIVKVNPYNHAGYVQNMKFSKELFNKHRDKLEALLETYFESGGTQAMITVVDRRELEEALIYPDKYQNLFVRIGGFSAKFIELPKEVQLDIINRTLY